MFKLYGIEYVDLYGLFDELVKSIEPNAEIEKIYVFSSKLYNINGARDKQNIYHKKLTVLYPDIIEFKYGEILERRKKYIKVGTNNKEKVKVKILEEKQTDVSIGCEMINDAHTEYGITFDISCLATDDTDFIPTLKKMKELNKRVFLFTPKIAGYKIKKIKSDKTDIRKASRSLREFVNKKDRIPEFKKELVKKYRIFTESEITKLVKKQKLN